MPALSTPIQWLHNLRNCQRLSEAGDLLCHAVTALAGADNAGLYLLDYTGKQLVLTSSFPASMTSVETTVSLSATASHDPLGFALQNGTPYEVSLAEHIRLPDSLTLLAGKETSLRHLFSLPLFGYGNKVIGGLMAAGHEKPEFTEEVLLVCSFAALLMDGINKNEKKQDLLRSLEEDLHRLEKQQTRSISEYEIVGKSPVMKKVRDLIAKTARSDAAVLIVGETGTGKELVATAIHGASARNDKKFVKINCAALPAPLLESELFGHKKGAFSGADTEHTGLLRDAHGGTILLDEIGDMPLELQAKLLRVLQDGMVRPVGHVEEYPVNVRFLASTNCDLSKAMEAGLFRTDLYHRLAVCTITLPPLRDKPEDIPELAEHILDHLRNYYDRPHLRLAPETMEVLLATSYPGNVRELSARIHKAVVLAGEQTALLTPDLFVEANGQQHDTPALTAMMEQYEAGLIASALERHAGNISVVARELGIARSTLHSKIKKYALLLSPTTLGARHGHYV